MTIETLQNRITSLEEKINKKKELINKKNSWIEKKLNQLSKLGYNENEYERAKTAYHNGEGEAFWLFNDIESYKSDIESAEKDLKSFEISLEDYKNELNIMQSKIASRNVQVIIDFLNDWGAKVKDFYLKTFNKYYAELDKVQDLNRQINKFNYGTPEYNEANENYRQAYNTLHAKLYGEVGIVTNKYGLKTKAKVKSGEWEFIANYVEYNTLDEAIAKLDKELKEEKELKYDYIIERTNKIVGTITDASDLSIGLNGELNGFIKGTEGVAKVWTIGAGGYNNNVIVNERKGQIYHFRVYVKEVK